MYSRILPIKALLFKTILNIISTHCIFDMPFKTILVQNNPSKNVPYNYHHSSRIYGTIRRSIAYQYLQYLSIEFQDPLHLF
jgi:hypothetical protein